MRSVGFALKVFLHSTQRKRWLPFRLVPNRCASALHVGHCMNQYYNKRLIMSTHNSESPQWFRRVFPKVAQAIAVRNGLCYNVLILGLNVDARGPEERTGSMRLD